MSKERIKINYGEEHDKVENSDIKLNCNVSGIVLHLNLQYNLGPYNLKLQPSFGEWRVIVIVIGFNNIMNEIKKR